MHPARRAFSFFAIAVLAACSSRPAPPVARPRPVDVGAATGDAGFTTDDGGDEPGPGGVITLDEMICGPDAIMFAPNQTTIDGEGTKTIAKEAAAWRDAAAQTVVEVAAFSAPNEKDAVALSQRRAEAVVEALVIAGVDRRILRPAGYGAYCAMAPEVTAKDPQQRNRFAYLALTATSSGPTDARPGCDAARKAGLGLTP